MSGFHVQSVTLSSSATVGKDSGSGQTDIREPGRSQPTAKSEPLTPADRREPGRTQSPAFMA